jgi:hypothetical protein
MKRTLVGSSTILAFKELLTTKGAEIIGTERSRIPDRSIDAESFKTYIADQRAQSDDDAKVLEMLKDSITHVSADRMFTDIERLSASLWGKLSTFPDNRFYIVLSGSKKSNNKSGSGSASGSKSDGCFYKSNMFLATVMMSYRPELADSFVDFICDSQPLHTRMDKSVLHYVYVDDASFSGNQLAENMEELGELIDAEAGSGDSQDSEESQDSEDAERTDSDDGRRPPPVNPNDSDSKHVHLVVLYVSPATMVSIRQEILRQLEELENVSIRVHWYSTSTHQRPVMDYLHGFVVDNPGSDIDRVMETAVTFLRGSKEGDDLHKPLFYTDIKISDDVSTYPLFLLRPVLIRGGGRAEAYPVSLVSGCPVATDSDVIRINSGVFCPEPVYKGAGWKTFIGSTPLQG